jgi:hypothetical protein
MTNKHLFSLASMTPILDAIKADISEANAQGLPGASFNVEYLTTDYARFVLAGIVNRMDRAWSFVERDRDSCGEIRFIYRLVYHVELLPKLPGRFVDSYLPMTINLVLRAHDSGDEATCTELAKNWLHMADHQTGALPDRNQLHGILVNVSPAHVDRLEINMQSTRWGASSVGKKRFRWAC